MAKILRNPLLNALFEIIGALVIVIGGSWIFIHERQVFYGALVVILLIAVVVNILRGKR